MLVLYCYPTCGTCKKAKQWLKTHDIEFTERQIAETPPTKEQLRAFQKASGLPLKKFFNTSGKHYRDQGMKDKLKNAPEDKWLDWLAADGMLVKRPIAVDGDAVTIGFNETDFEKTWLNKAAKK
ncbi:MAG: arsenate reductase family protein [Sporolactobacillus sp.]